MKQLTAFQRDILFVIAELGKANGVTILDALEGYYAEEIYHGRLYSNLDQLVDCGLVVKGEMNKRTNSYTLTESGESAIKERLLWQENRVD